VLGELSVGAGYSPEKRQFLTLLAIFKEHYLNFQEYRILPSSFIQLGKDYSTNGMELPVKKDKFISIF